MDVLLLEREKLYNLLENFSNKLYKSNYESDDELEYETETELETDDEIDADTEIIAQPFTIENILLNIERAKMIVELPKEEPVIIIPSKRPIDIRYDFFEFEKKINLPDLVKNELKKYLFKKYVDEKSVILVNEYQQIFDNIKLMIRDRLLNHQNILNNNDLEHLNFKDDSLKFSEDEKIQLLNSKSCSMMRSLASNGTLFRDLDSQYFGYHSDYLDRNNYLNYYLNIFSDHYLNHLTTLFIYGWEIIFSEHTGINKTIYGSIIRIEPSDDKIEFVSEISRKMDDINQYHSLIHHSFI